MLKVYGLARLTRDPEIKGNDGNIVKFGVAVNDYKKNPHYFDVTAFNMGSYELAHIIDANFSKGDQIFIKDAELEYQTWDDKDGNKRHAVGIKLNRFEFVGGGGGGGGKKKETDNSPF